MTCIYLYDIVRPFLWWIAMLSMMLKIHVFIQFVLHVTVQWGPSRYLLNIMCTGDFLFVSVCMTKKVNYCVNESEWYVICLKLNWKKLKLFCWIVMNLINDLQMLIFCFLLLYVMFILTKSHLCIVVVSCKLLLASELYGNVGNIDYHSWVRCRTWRGYFIFLF